MKHAVTSLLTAGIMLFGAQAFADDATHDRMERDHRTQKAMMKECMHRMHEKDEKNQSMSRDQMKDACQREVTDSTATERGVTHEEGYKDEVKKY